MQSVIVKLSLFFPCCLLRATSFVPLVTAMNAVANDLPIVVVVGMIVHFVRLHDRIVRSSGYPERRRNLVILAEPTLGKTPHTDLRLVNTCRVRWRCRINSYTLCYRSDLLKDTACFPLNSLAFYLVYCGGSRIRSIFRLHARLLRITPRSLVQCVASLAFLCEVA